LYRWRDYAGSVSTEELQSLWGKLLAGEVKKPGTHSYRVLDFIKNLTPAEAEAIEKIGPFVIAKNIVAKDHADILEKNGISFDHLLNLQELGILASVDVGLSMVYSSVNGENGNFLRPLFAHNRVLVISKDEKVPKLPINIYSVTKLGQQVLSLGKFKANDEYLVALGEKLQKSGFKVRLCDHAPAENGHVVLSNCIQINPPAEKSDPKGQS
jgi:hypothetical protein